MPYIKQEDRENVNVSVEGANEGELNYLISTLCDLWLQEEGLRYKNINTLIGVLECVKLELYRRVAAPYEDIKIKENGDVYEVLSGRPDDGSAES